VYNLLCDSLGMEPAPNNGTLRLPLKPIGTHKEEDTPEVPEDPVTTTSAAPEKQPTTSEKPAETTAPAPAPEGDDSKDSSNDQPTLEPPKENPGNDDGKDDDDDDDSIGGKIKVWWDWVVEKVGDVVDKIKGTSDSDDD
jgi:hypothetical protein